MRLKGVGRSPLSVARVGLLAVGPEGDQDRDRGKAGREKERETKTMIEIKQFAFVILFCV